VDNSGALDRLDFPRVRVLLSDLATSFSGKEALRTVSPFPSLAEARNTLGLVDRLKKRHAAGDGLPPLPVDDLRATFVKLGIRGSRLDAGALMGLGPLLRASRTAKESLRRSRDEAPELAALGEPLCAFPHLERALDETFEDDGGIKDRASPELRRIRREREGRRERLRNRMERMAASLTREEGATLVTLREGRFVLAVPGDQRRRVEGLVQDRSATGGTFYIEPLETVEDNNALREMDAEEAAEIQRILAALTDRFREVREDLAGTWEHLGILDGLRARALLGLRWQGEPAVLDDSETARVHLRGARHPLLLEARGVARDAASARTQVVPLDLDLDGETRLLLITGPNMGGKTVSLKTLGLLSVLAQCGCLVPADPGCVLPWVEGWVVSLGDEQSLDQDLSTFAAHLRRWAEALDRAGTRSLVLLDELGSGTDPTEGAALAQSVLERLVEAGAIGLVTTHLGSLKGFAAEAEGMQNASMVFDGGTRRATFRMAVGIPGESHAMDMARSLGFPEERVARAEALLPEEERDLRRLLGDLEAERARVAETREALEARLAEAESAAAQHRERLERLLEERAALRARAARQARELLRRAEETLKEVERSARRNRLPAGVDRKALAREQVRLARLEAPRPVRGEGRAPERVVAGDDYWAPVLGRAVRVVRIMEGSDTVLVESKGMRVTLPAASLRVLDAEKTPAPEPAPAPTIVRPEATEAAMEVSVRGLRVDEALEKLERALDQALLAGLRELRVIHGKGTGTLRRAVEEYCRNHSAVKGTRIADQWQGGTGATVIELEG
jgi:DNA mismatch repair protein MutS2